jgi:rubrerythrin
VSNQIEIGSVADLLAHVKAMETEAMESYQDLAEQMDVHHNAETAQLFRKMAEVESLHVQKVLERAEGMELPHIPPWEYKWIDGETPESVTNENTHYLMTPHHALQLALKAETRALDFFTQIAEQTEPGTIHDLAVELRDEEREHVQLIADWLAKTPEPDDGWDEDPDPPMLQE